MTSTTQPITHNFNNMEFFGEYRGKPGVCYTRNQLIYKEFRNKRLKIEDEIGQLNSGEVYFAAIETLLDKTSEKKFEAVKETEVISNLNICEDVTIPFVDGKLLATKGGEYGVAYKTQKDLSYALFDYRDEVNSIVIILNIFFSKTSVNLCFILLI